MALPGLAAAAARATPLFDRLRPDSAAQAGDSAGLAALDAWCRAVAGGDPNRFGERLALDGLTRPGVLSALGDERPAPRDLPAWTQTISDVVEAAAAAADGMQVPEAFDPAAHPIPFEHILAPFVAVGARRLAERSGAAANLLSRPAHAALERGLLLRLSQLCAPTFALKFSVDLACHQAEGASPFEPPGAPATGRYAAFVRRMLQRSLWPTLRDYPVLARLAATLVDLWVEATAEFLARLQADAEVIARGFGSQAQPPWCDAEACGSDRHNGGRSVIILTAGSGLRVVYKPKNLGIESAYGRLLDWLNDRGSPLPLKTLTVVDRGSHGWVEFAAQHPCATPQEAARFYRRTGMLLCLHYILETTDCHRENLVACGEHPVIVDLETVMHPREKDAADAARADGAEGVANERIWHSVLRVGLLPRWDVSKGPGLDLSGLGSFGRQQSRYLVWQDINTDRMVQVEELREMARAHNEPMLGAEPAPPHVFRADIADGFQAMYGFLQAQRGALSDPSGPLAALAAQEVRFVFRGTSVYHLLHQRLAHPAFLRDGVARSIELDVLARRFLEGQPLAFWPLLRAERDAMERLDVPSFAARPDSDSLVLPAGRVIAHCFVEPSQARVLRRLRQMDETDLNRQKAFIRGALFSRASGAPHKEQLLNVREPCLDAVAPLDEQALLAQAIAIAEALRQRAIRSADGGATWIAPTHMLEADRFQLQVLGCDLYNGSTGVALFLAALEGVTGGAGFRDLALGALAPLRESLNGAPPSRNRFAAGLGIGGVSGLGAVVYTLVRAARFLQDDALLDEARTAADLITREAIAGDEALDIFDGSAGAILGLLSLHDACGHPWALQAALLCGMQLERHQEVWSSLERRPLTGCSHGAAGIALALLRLHQATGEARFHALAAQGIAYERQVFAASAGNWPDYRLETDPGAPPTFFTTWCHGAPGIGLARLGGLAALDTPEVRRDIDVALATTLAYGLRPLEDHLCCGHFGRMDLLVTASERLGRPELLRTARRQARWVVDRAAQCGDFQLHDRLPHGVENPGFYTGSAGIGYELLRLAYPAKVPSALLWA